MVTLTGSTLSTTTTYVLPSPHSYSSITPRFSRITSNDDDEIVWNVSEADMSSGSAHGAIMSDEDLVVLAKPRLNSSTPVENEPLKQKNSVSATKLLEMQMSALSLSSKAATKKAKKIKRSKKATASPVQCTTTTQQGNGKSSVGLAGDPSPVRSPKHADIVQVLHVSISWTNVQFIPVEVISAIEQLGLGQRPIVDDLSEQLSVISGDKTPTVYEEASTYISMCVLLPSYLPQLNIIQDKRLTL